MSLVNTPATDKAWPAQGRPCWLRGVMDEVRNFSALRCLSAAARRRCPRRGRSHDPRELSVRSGIAVNRRVR